MTKYTSLKVRLAWKLFITGKWTWAKVWNALYCHVAYWRKWDVSGRTPILISFETTNHCNESCVFCRSETGEIYDLKPGGGVIPKGTMSLETVTTILSQVGRELAVAVPYVNGEPLIYKHLEHVLKVCQRHRVATILATNGIRLDFSTACMLIRCDLDVLKVHVSGWSQAVHAIQHREGDIEHIRMGLEALYKARRNCASRMIVLVDYILYRHNEHEVELWRAYARKLGFLFSVRPGNPKGMEATELLQPTRGSWVKDLACDWLWKALTINWNGDVLPCCDYVVRSDAEGHGRFHPDRDNLCDIWNGPAVQTMRRIHRDQGRTPLAICSTCPRVGVEFKF